MTVKHAEVDQAAAGDTVSQERSTAQGAAQSGAGPLMFLVVALFVGSALISVTLLWLAFRGIGSLLLQG